MAVDFINFGSVYSYLFLLLLLFLVTITVATVTCIQRSHNPAVPFSILSMSANPTDEDLIAVCGLKECHVLSLSRSGAVAKSTVLHPALDTGEWSVLPQRVLIDWLSLCFSEIGYWYFYYCLFLTL